MTGTRINITWSQARVINMHNTCMFFIYMHMYVKPHNKFMDKDGRWVAPQRCGHGSGWSWRHRGVRDGRFAGTEWKVLISFYPIIISEDAFFHAKNQIQKKCTDSNSHVPYCKMKKKHTKKQIITSVLNENTVHSLANFGNKKWLSKLFIIGVLNGWMDEWRNGRWMRSEKNLTFLCYHSNRWNSKIAFE